MYTGIIGLDNHFRIEFNKYLDTCKIDYTCSQEIEAMKKFLVIYRYYFPKYFDAIKACHIIDNKETIFTEYNSSSYAKEEVELIYYPPNSDWDVTVRIYNPKTNKVIKEFASEYREGWDGDKAIKYCRDNNLVIIDSTYI